MQVNSIVQCIRGYEGILEEGAYYTVAEVTQNGHLLLMELYPPYPHNCFDKTRFKEVQSPEEFTDILTEVIFELMD